MSEINLLYLYYLLHLYFILLIIRATNAVSLHIRTIKRNYVASLQLLIIPLTLFARCFVTRFFTQSFFTRRVFG